MKRLEYRMYGLVPYNISPIQQGIQFGHGVVEYGLLSKPEGDESFLDWAKNDKTFIILNGGTTNFGIKGRAEGTLNQHAKTLKSMGVKTAKFHEPDLGDQLTAVVFLVDERVWDEEKYPSPERFPLFDILTEQQVVDMNDRNRVAISRMGGEGIWELRQFIKQFRLA